MVSKNKMQIFYTQFKQILSLVGLAILFTACIPNKNNTRITEDTAVENSVTETNGGQTNNQPVFLEGGSFLDNGVVKSYSLTDVNIDTGINLLLRGPEIHTYLSQGTHASEIVCLVGMVQEAVTNRWIVIAASPGQLYDYQNQAKEFYYSISINNETINRTFCQKSGLITELGNLSPLDTISYSLEKICEDCSHSFFNTGSLKLYQKTGAFINTASVSSLRLRIKNTPTVSGTGDSCSSASDCTVNGYDCCGGEGVCINDKTLKFSVDQSSTEFLQAQNDIQLNSSNIYKYPNFYNLCPISVVDDDTDTTSSQTISPEDQAALNFQNLKDLYECTTLIQGEMSLCTVNYKNATTSQIQLFYTGDDDKNFINTYSGSIDIPEHSIVEVRHAGQTLFKDDVFLRPGEVKIGANNSLVGNDSLTDPTVIELYRTLPSSAINDTLSIKYKIDGSCEYVNSSAASCTKYYKQGQNTGSVDDHFPASNKFKLPSYIDLNKTITVKVDGIIKFQGTDWEINTFNGVTLDFLGNDLKVYDNQIVTINYFADLSSNNVIDSKLKALTEIKSKCGCVELDCRLKPLTNTVNGKETITDYICDYPDPDIPPAPQQQIVMLSSKTVPLRFHDENGAAVSEVDINTPDQEGIEFKYINNDLLRPNNVTQYIGIHEIFGSFNNSSGSAVPAKEIRVDAGKVYDIYVDSGSYSTCFNCGVDYHNFIAKLFPSNFLHRGGGWEPEPFETSRKSSTVYRADDISFGRACFVPPTMLPWSHKPNSSVQRQRMDRLETQHFYYANGYNRDWYGFDYGSVIGSFDGVNWFSIGNQRRIKAKSHKLFLALNQIMGDLTMESTFQVTVIDSIVSRTSLSVITSDFESDGAQCQKYHQCTNDQDCVTNLGWDYTCEAINTLTTKWPVFDNLAKEIADQEEEQRLYTLFNAGTGGARRCVYRGRGTACHQDMTFASEDQSFNGATTPGLLSCGQNFYCQEFIQGAQAKKFNTKISRYGKSPAAQNSSSLVEEDTLDTFGMHTRYTARPFSYIGEEEVTDTALNNLSHNNILGMCLPGRNPETFNNKTSLSANPSNLYQGDKVLGIGMTVDSLQDGRFLSSCPVIDTDSELFHFKQTNINASLDSSFNSEIYNLSAGQNLSTSHLDVFESILGKKASEIFENKQITTRTLEDNRCLRAPGSTCYTDLDCSGNDYINTFLNRVNSNDSSAQSVINKQEILFWQEKLTCSQQAETTDEDYSQSNNRCCRLMGNSITIPTYVDQVGFSAANQDAQWTEFDNSSIPGIDISLDNPNRYSRNAVVHYEKSQNPEKYPALEVVGKNKCAESGCQSSDTLTNQFHTVDLFAKKTCCNKNWIREFHTDNGGGHRWSPTKMQTFDKKNLKCYNWATYDATVPLSAKSFDCSHVESLDDPGCFVRNLTEPIYNPILELMGEIELLGIPQVSVKAYQHEGMQCTTNMTNQYSDIVFSIVPGVFSDSALFDTSEGEYKDTNNEVRFSAIDKSNFHDDLKMVFSPDKLTCCLPAGTEVEAGTDKDLCCTGFINERSGKCALPDFSNLSVYFNRYVSSEANDLADSLFDQKTGYVKDATTVISLACQKQVCASGCLMLGVSVSNLVVQGKEDSGIKFSRFIDGDDSSVNNRNGLATFFNNGAKWDNQVYCAPPAVTEGADGGQEIAGCLDTGQNGDELTTDVTIIDCQQ